MYIRKKIKKILTNPSHIKKYRLKPYSRKARGRFQTRHITRHIFTIGDY